MPADVTTIANARTPRSEHSVAHFHPAATASELLRFPPSLDIDRYDIDGEMRDYIVAAREISPNNLQETRRTGSTSTTVYTHGDGLVAAPANKITAPVLDPTKDNANNNNAGYPI